MGLLPWHKNSHHFLLSLHGPYSLTQEFTLYLFLSPLLSLVLWHNSSHKFVISLCWVSFSELKVHITFLFPFFFSVLWHKISHNDFFFPCWSFSLWHKSSHHFLLPPPWASAPAPPSAPLGWFLAPPHTLGAVPWLLLCWLLLHPNTRPVNQRQSGYNQVITQHRNTQKYQTNMYSLQLMIDIQRVSLWTVYENRSMNVWWNGT